MKGGGIRRVERGGGRKGKDGGAVSERWVEREGRWKGTAVTSKEQGEDAGIGHLGGARKKRDGTGACTRVDHD